MVENRKNNKTKGLIDNEKREWSERVKRYEAEPKTKKYQRFQAISRHPEYIKEYKIFKELDGTYPELRLEEDYIKQYERDNNYGKGSVWYYEDYNEHFFKHVKDSEEYKKRLDTINKKIEKNRDEAMVFQVGILNK